MSAPEEVSPLGTGHSFGTEAEGRDLYARTVQRTRPSAMIGLLGALVAAVGRLRGAVAGHVGGHTDDVPMRIAVVVPFIPLMAMPILSVAIVGRSTLMLFIGIGLIPWLSLARIARGQRLSNKNKEALEAAVATGVRPMTTVRRPVAPDLVGVVVVYATLPMPEMSVDESFISVLGLGGPEPDASLGALISRGSTQVLGRCTWPWQLRFPLAFVVLLPFFVSDGPRDALDPQDR